jgi:hypothetical protein
VIQACAHWDDIAVAGAGAVQRQSDRFFFDPRPPMLKDFFDPALARCFSTQRLRKELRVTFQVETIKLAI